MKARRWEDPSKYVIREEIETNAIGTCSPLFSSSAISSATMARGGGSNVKIKVRRRILSDDESLYIAQSKWDGKGLFTMIPRDEVSGMDQESRRESIIRMAKNAKSKLTRMSSLKAVSGLRWKDIMSKQSKSHARDQGGSQEQQSAFQSQNNSFESGGDGSETDLRRWTLTKQYSSSVNSSSSVTLPPSDQQRQQQQETVPKIAQSNQESQSLNRTSSDRDIQSEGGERDDVDTPSRWKSPFKSSSLRFKRLSLKGWRHRK